MFWLRFLSILRNVCVQLCPTLLQPHGLQIANIFCPWNFPGKNIGVLPFTALGDLPDTETEPPSFKSPVSAGRFFYHCVTWKTPRRYISHGQFHMGLQFDFILIVQDGEFQFRNQELQCSQNGGILTPIRSKWPHYRPHVIPTD